MGPLLPGAQHLGAQLSGILWLQRPLGRLCRFYGRARRFRNAAKHIIVWSVLPQDGLIGLNGGIRSPIPADRTLTSASLAKTFDIPRAVAQYWST